MRAWIAVMAGSLLAASLGCAGSHPKPDDVTQEITTKEGADVDGQGRVGVSSSLEVARCEGQTSDGQCEGSAGIEVRHDGPPTPKNVPAH